MLVVTLRVAALAVAVAVVALVVRQPLVFLLEAPLAVVLLASIFFFRNPRRRPPAGPGILVSPADGRVSDVEALPEGEYVGGPCVRVGIFLSILSVHVNRAPDDGEVEYLRYRPGKFHDARDALCITENESQAIGIRLDDDGARVLVRQISGAIARRILCPLVEGQHVVRGGMIGMIKYGSRTELYAPLEGGGVRWEPAVEVGDRVRGGKTVLFRAVAVEGPGAVGVDRGAGSG